MGIFTSKNAQQLIDSVSESLDDLSDGVSKRPHLSDRVRKRTVLKASLIAGGLAALTAGSAGVSSLRRHLEAPDS